MGYTDLSNDIKAAHILMVDDDKDDLTLTKTSFERSKFPFKFTGLEKASELFNYIENNDMSDIDILLLDLNMPVVGGLDALKKLQQHPDRENIRVFIYSTSSRAEDKDQCLEAGANGYLVKPEKAHDVERFVNTVALASDFWV